MKQDEEKKDEDVLEFSEMGEMILEMILETERKVVFLMILGISILFFAVPKQTDGRTDSLIEMRGSDQKVWTRTLTLSLITNR